MTVCKSTRKKTNRFEELSESDVDHKTPDLVGPSSITNDSGMKQPNSFTELKDSFLAFQQSTNNHICQIGFSFQQVTDSISDLRDSIVDLHSSHQNKPNYNAEEVPTAQPTSTHMGTTGNTHNFNRHSPTTYNVDTNTNVRDPDYDTTNHNHYQQPTYKPTGPSAPHKFWKITSNLTGSMLSFKGLLFRMILCTDCVIFTTRLGM